ncbi:MAG: adenylate/guanylate cyclase domain-containing protein [Dehalococcoidia bacterium]
MEPQIRFCTSADGTRIAYTTVGSGRPLLVVEAWVASLEWNQEHPDPRAYAEGLAQGRSLVSFDRRGIGVSQRDVDDLSLEAHVGDLAAIADELQLETFDLFGFGDGSWVSVAYAAQNPDRVSRVVLWGVSPQGTDYLNPAAARGMAELIRGNWSLGRRAISDGIFPNGPIELQRWFSRHLRESISAEMAARYIDYQISVDVTAYLPLVKAPTLVLHRRGDRNLRIAAGKAAAALIQDARLLALEGDDPAPSRGDISYLQTVLQFLDEGRAPPGAQPTTGGAMLTLLMTDMEGSTNLTQRLGDAGAQEVLRTHNSIIRDALKAHSGSETKHTGDGIMASFPSASRALEAAVAIQKAFADHNQNNAHTAIRVRIGLNSGEPVVEEDDLFGTAVQLAARVCAPSRGPTRGRGGRRPPPGKCLSLH